MIQITLRICKIVRCHTTIHKSFYHKFNINNFDDYFIKYFDKCKESIVSRNHSVNIEQLNRQYQNYTSLVSDIKSATTEKEANFEQMEKIGQQNHDSIAGNEIKEKGKIIRNKLKTLMAAESKSRKEILQSLKILPNLIEPNTPIEERIVCESGVLSSGRNHLDLCGSQIKMRSYSLNVNEPIITAYLSGDLALFELDLYNKIHDQLKQLKTYQHIIHPDMIKGFVVETCLEENERKLKIFEKSPEKEESDSEHRLVLCGSSLPGFLAYISTLNIQSSKLPNKFYSLGRNYRAGGNLNHGLYDMSQTMQAELFSIHRNRDASLASFDEEKKLILNLYQSLGLPFKMVEVAAKDLSENESKRYDFYIWSPGFNQYFKCGHLRSLGDHVSRKLSLVHQRRRSFFKMNHSVIIKLPTIMAAIIEKEQSSKTFSETNSLLSLK